MIDTIKTSKGENTYNKRIIRNKNVMVVNQNRDLLLMAFPAMLCLLLFNYLPMLGLVMAFKDFRYDKGILGSDWVGFNNFDFFFSSQSAWRVTRNTIGYNAVFIVLGLLIAIIFALMLNEIFSRKLVKFYQTVMFFPYFISWIVVSYMAFAFLNMQHGILNSMLESLGLNSVNWYTEASYWPFILIFTNIWKQTGYSSVIFYAGLMSIDKQYYEAASIDGATKLQLITKISIPFLTPLIVVLALLAIGRIFYADFGLFYHLPKNIGMLYSTTDVIDTYVYRSLRVVGDIGMSTAAGLYQSMVGFLLVVGTNAIVKKINKDNALF